MRLVVFGAGGGVGSRAVLAASGRGHEVAAAARTRPASGPGVEAMAVDVRDAEAVDRAIRGADAVLWCVGVTKRSGGDVGRTAMPLVVAAALRHGVTRLVSVSGAGVTLPGDQKGPGARLVSALTRRLAHDLVVDKEGEHAVLAASELAWTELRPPRLSETDGTGRYAFVSRAPGITARPVPKADVASAMVDLAESGLQIRRSPFLVAG